MSVLLVEDSPAEARLTQEALSEADMDHDLHIVSDGEMAMRYLRREDSYTNAPTPSIILLDLNLPRKHGREVLQEIKSDRELSMIPVIVVSNSRAPEDIEEVYRLKGNCFLTKPADLDELYSMMRALVEFWLRKAQLPSTSLNYRNAKPVSGE